MFEMMNRLMNKVEGLCTSVRELDLRVSEQEAKSSAPVSPIKEDLENMRQKYTKNIYRKMLERTFVRGLNHHRNKGKTSPRTLDREVDILLIIIVIIIAVSPLNSSSSSSRRKETRSKNDVIHEGTERCLGCDDDAVAAATITTTTAATESQKCMCAGSPSRACEIDAEKRRRRRRRRSRANGLSSRNEKNINRRRRRECEEHSEREERTNERELKQSKALAGGGTTAVTGGCCAGMTPCHTMCGRTTTTTTRSSISSSMQMRMRVCRCPEVVELLLQCVQCCAPPCKYQQKHAPLAIRELQLRRAKKLDRRRESSSSSRGMSSTSRPVGLKRGQKNIYSIRERIVMYNNNNNNDPVPRAVFTSVRYTPFSPEQWVDMSLCSRSPRVSAVRYITRAREQNTASARVLHTILYTQPIRQADPTSLVRVFLFIATLLLLLLLCCTHTPPPPPLGGTRETGAAARSARKRRHGTTAAAVRSRGAVAFAPQSPKSAAVVVYYTHVSRESRKEPSYSQTRARRALYFAQTWTLRVSLVKSLRSLKLTRSAASLQRSTYLQTTLIELCACDAAPKKKPFQTRRCNSSSLIVNLSRCW
ncbi:unnamed protein product, partial [Trichogramma brassicae]